MFNSRIVLDRYSNIHITLVSMLLALALADLVSIIRSIEQPTTSMWLFVILIVLVSINAWIGYSTFALSVRVVPSLSDVFGAFGLGAIHFLMNSTLSEEPYYFFLVFSGYNIIGGSLMIYNIKRTSQDESLSIDVKPFYPVILMNLIMCISFGIIGIISWKGNMTNTHDKIAVVWALILSSLWLYLYWKGWITQLGPYNPNKE